MRKRSRSLGMYTMKTLVLEIGQNSKNVGSSRNIKMTKYNESDI